MIGDPPTVSVPEIIPGLPPIKEVRMAATKEPYSPDKGLTPAINEKEIAVGTNTSETVIPDNISFNNEVFLQKK